jgi:hypothetical protein
MHGDSGGMAFSTMAVLLLTMLVAVAFLTAAFH